MKTRIALISIFNIDFGVRYISAYLKSKGYHTDIISFGALRLKEEIFCNNYITPGLLHQKACPDGDDELLVKLLLSLKPDLIGITVPSTSFITASILTQKIKEKLNVPIIWGGIHATLCPEHCIQYADMVCIGEGEYPMYELAEKLENTEQITAIKNLWIKDRDGSIEKNELRDLILELDSLPYPDFAGLGNKFLIDRGKVIPDPIIVSAYREKAYPIMSSRGCHYSCSFCCNSVLKEIYKNKGPYLRRRTPENVIDEIVYIRTNMEAWEIRFWDDIFTYDAEWIEVFHQLYKRKVALPFTCYAHPEHTDRTIIEMLANSGLKAVDLGIQSGSESFCRDRFKRKQSNEEIIEFAKVLKKFGVIPRYNLIMDNPYETDSDLDATAELLMALPRPYITRIYSLCYFPKTPLTNQSLKDKLITEEDVEGRDNKALNNFYMFIDLAKDKKTLFWDTIMAMVVSSFFSEKLIRRCKRSRFIRSHPRLLLSLIRLYLRISFISPMPIFHKELRTKWFRKALRFFLSISGLCLGMNIFHKDISKIFKKEFFFTANLIAYHLEGVTTETNNQDFRNKAKIDLLIYPKDSTNAVCKSFYLKIGLRNSFRLPLILKMLVELTDSLIATEPGERLALWEIDYKINDIETETEVDLLYPRLFFTQKGIRREVSLVEVKKVTKKGLYGLRVFLYSGRHKRYILKNCSVVYF
ncbi:MAG: B12-binding domain-containing radical SAM protein [Candidatus Omnitrophica bacterium]|nr:B12-binding domain-containing radical SAM protein [Candidatus Omnitrophota bacterium]